MYATVAQQLAAPYGQGSDPLPCAEADNRQRLPETVPRAVGSLWWIHQFLKKKARKDRGRGSVANPFGPPQPVVCSAQCFTKCFSFLHGVAQQEIY